MLTAGARRSLRAMAIALLQGRPVMLEGPAGCGKSALVAALAAATGNDGGPAAAAALSPGDGRDADALANDCASQSAAPPSESAGLLVLHLDDQADSKALLGGYVCGARPGEFRWAAGPLAQAVARGQWTVVEGVDTAPGEVLAALGPLLESVRFARSHAPVHRWGV